MIYLGPFNGQVPHRHISTFRDGSLSEAFRPCNHFYRKCSKNTSKSLNIETVPFSTNVTVLIGIPINELPKSYCLTLQMPTQLSFPHTLGSC